MYPEDAAEVISEDSHGLHCLIIYSDLSMLREFYSHYIPQQTQYKKKLYKFTPFMKPRSQLGKFSIRVIKE